MTIVYILLIIIGIFIVSFLAAWCAKIDLRKEPEEMEEQELIKFVILNPMLAPAKLIINILTKWQIIK